ncbi:MAG: thioredoxin family protein [Edaphobacter sp.]
MNTNSNDLSHKVVSNDEWLEARKVFLAKEKAFTRQRDELSRERRELPWVKVEKNYVFHGPNGKQSLADLFDGRSQLVVYHFMFGPEWEQGCPSCSFEADHFNSFIVHLNARDVSMATVSRAPIEKLQAFRKRMGWSFKWVSSYQTDFNTDYRVSFTRDEMANGKVNYNYGMNVFPSDEAPGVSVFYKDAAGDIFHTYSAYARGLDILLGAYNFLDLAPKGRDEDALPYPMTWVRHHDRYGNDPLVNLLASDSTRVTEEALA